MSCVACWIIPVSSVIATRWSSIGYDLAFTDALCRKRDRRGLRSPGAFAARSERDEQPAVVVRHVRPRHLAAEPVGAAFGRAPQIPIVEQRSDRFGDRSGAA